MQTVALIFIQKQTENRINIKVQKNSRKLHLNVKFKWANQPVPGSVFLDWLLPWSVNHWISTTLDPVSWWGPAQRGHMSPGCRSPSWGLVGWPEATIKWLSLGCSTKVVPGMVVGGVDGTGGLGGGVVGTGRVGVRCHWPFERNVKMVNL